MYKVSSSYVLHMEAKVLGIGEFRKQLSERVEAANWGKEVTVVMHDKRKEPRAALVPFDVGATPLPIANKDDIRSYVVSREWFERAQAALGEK
jgi:antitoxin (DNA-binding transcriptional repressor) of toxin-antitoxin stability system